MCVGSFYSVRTEHLLSLISPLNFYLTSTRRGGKSERADRLV